MTSLTASESFTPLPYVPLALNSRGELGFMVNPSACSCTTCVDYVGPQRSASPAPRPLATLPPPQHSLTDTGSGFWARFGPRSNTDVDFSLAHFNTLPPGDPSLARSSSVVEETLEERTLEERTLESLRRLRAHLHERQDVLYDDEQRSHDEMAAADTEWEELDRKMTAIDALLEAFEPQ